MTGGGEGFPGSRPERIVLTGPMASGKTTVGRIVAARLGWAFVDTDEEVARRAGAGVAEIFATRGEAAFRDLEAAVLEEALARSRTVIATGGGMVLRPGNRLRMLRDAFVACLLAAPETLARRAAADGAAIRPLLGAGDPLSTLKDLMAERAPHYAQAHATITTDGRSPEDVAAEVIARYRDAPAVERVDVGGPGNPLAHTVWIGRGLAARAGDLLAAAAVPHRPGRPALLVVDGAVAGTHAPLVEAALAAAGFRPAVAPIPPGEGSKTLDVAATLYEAAVRAGLERGDPVVALGGGVVTDLAGFVAATYLRGVPWLAVPTSLLAQVDAAVGGKTGVNLAAGKNLVGAFHAPAAVVCDPALLATLPDAEWRNGLAECVKCGAIADAAYFELLEREADHLRARDLDLAERLVAGSVGVKARCVSVDPLERGPRALLNFGHTVGHALEALLGYRDMRHGEAVAVGMAVAADLSVACGLLAPSDRDRLEALLAGLGLPTRLPAVPAEQVLEAAGRDKKRKGGRLRWVLLSAIGSATVRDDVGSDAVLAALRRRGAE